MVESRHISIAWYLLFAGLFHLGLGLLPSVYFVETSPRFPKPKPGEIVIDNIEDANFPTVQTRRSESNIKADRKAKFLAEFQNRVEKETRAPRTARHSDSRVGGGVNAEKGEEEGTAGPDLSDLMRVGSSPYDLGEEIQEGTDTILNTDQFIYASFMNRIVEEIYDGWVRYAEEAVKKIQHTRKALSSGSYVTRVAVTLGQQGEVLAIQMVRSCGVAELDDATKRAFWDAEPFENPPIEMFKDKEFLKLTYEFLFELQNSSFNILIPSVI